MKFVALLVSSLLPVGLMAAPVADAIDAALAPAPGTTTARDVGDEIFKRDQNCQIVGSSSNVNCRSGPGTGYDIVQTLPLGSWWDFSCVSSGDCVTIGGTTNCGWDKTGGCYVNGHYTDNSCTQASLGWC